MMKQYEKFTQGKKELLNIADNNEVDSFSSHLIEAFL